MTYRVQEGRVGVHRQWLPEFVRVPNPSSGRLVDTVQNQLSTLNATLNIAAPDANLAYAVGQKTVVLASHELANAIHSSLAVHRQLTEAVRPIGRIGIRIGFKRRNRRTYGERPF